MTREQLQRKAERLREEGLQYREIAERLGVSHPTVYRWTNPSFAERQRDVARAWKERNRGKCACGVSIWCTSGECSDCRNQRLSEQTKVQIIAAIRRWADKYGRPPTATEWNPAHADARGDLAAARRWKAGDWPWAATAQYQFGSWANAIEAAGFPRPRVGRKAA